MSAAQQMVELHAPSTEQDWIILILLITVVYLVSRK